MEESFSGGALCICQCDNGLTAQSGFVLWAFQLELSYGEYINISEFKLLNYGLLASQSLNETF